MKDGGVHFLKTEVLELSLVAIPANASATIHTIKSLVGGHAASGVGRTLPPSSLPGDAGAATARHTMKNVSEQIADFQAARTPKAERMSTIMQKALDEGRTLSDDEKTEFDALATQVKDYADHIARLEAFEDIQKQAAQPVETPAAQKPSPRVSVEEPKLPPGIEFARYAMCLMAAKGNTTQAVEIARKRYPSQGRVQSVLKAAVDAGTTTDPTWAGALVDYQMFAGDFIEFLRPQTIVGKFGAGNIPSLRRVPFNVKIPGQTSGGAGYWVGEGAPEARHQVRLHDHQPGVGEGRQHRRPDRGAGALLLALRRGARA